MKYRNKLKQQYFEEKKLHRYCPKGNATQHLLCNEKIEEYFIKRGLSTMARQAVQMAIKEENTYSPHKGEKMT